MEDDFHQPNGQEENHLDKNALKMGYVNSQEGIFQVQVGMFLLFLCYFSRV